jgi:hypothetical protein
MTFPGVFVLIAFLLTATCAGDASDVCSRKPIGSVKAFFAPPPASREATVTVDAITPLPELQGFRYELRTADGKAARLTWLGAEAIGGVRAGGTYRFVVDYAPGFPDSSGLLIFERERLLFAALTDQQLFQHVLKSGIPGFELAMGEPACASRLTTTCFDAVVNRPLTVTHEGQRRTIHQGDRVRIGSYEVAALTVQQVTYSPRCADAGMPGVSLTIERRE